MRDRLRPTLLALALACLAAGGCTTRAWYDGLQASAASECNRRPPSERDACVARLNTLPYDEYAKSHAKPRE